MKPILFFIVLLIIPSAGRSQIQPDFNTVDGRISAIAAKFSDAYSVDPTKVSDFTIGTSVVDRFKADGIEEIQLICLDGFVKIFQMDTIPKRTVKEIQPTGTTEGTIFYTDGSASTSELFLCPGHSIAYLVIKKKG